MRKRTIFALGMCAAAFLGEVSLTFARQVQASAQSATKVQGQAVPSSGTQSSGQAKQPSGQQTATRHNQQTGQGTATRQNQSTGKPAPGQTAKQGAGQKAQTPKPPVIPPGFRLLSLSEGRAIAQGIAWADDEEGLSPDCSHLVHTLYQQAGYPYPYFSSLDLYRGTGPFLRVRYAHPGDLIVWRGHVGIVVSPREHSFFSTTSSGARVQSYRSAYWQARGYPHFFRYLTKRALKPANGTAEASSRPPQH